MSAVNRVQLILIVIVIIKLTVMVEVSEDIFYQVKKQILDKLDIILQKINLQIINYLHPEEESFTFIQLSSFEHEITHLFHYLDRLYLSLNTSVSFSSIHSYKSSVETYQAENQRLLIENQKLQSFIEELRKKQSQDDMTFEKYNNSHQINQNAAYFEQLQQKASLVKEQFQNFTKDIKKALKKYKFDMLQTRVEIISKLKQFEQWRRKEKVGERNSSNEMEKQHGEDGEQILKAINQILSIC